MCGRKRKDFSFSKKFWRTFSLEAADTFSPLIATWHCNIATTATLFSSDQTVHWQLLAARLLRGLLYNTNEQTTAMLVAEDEAARRVQWAYANNLVSEDGRVAPLNDWRFAVFAEDPNAKAREHQMKRQWFVRNHVVNGVALPNVENEIAYLRLQYVFEENSNSFRVKVGDMADWLDEVRQESQLEFGLNQATIPHPTFSTVGQLLKRHSPNSETYRNCVVIHTLIRNKNNGGNKKAKRVVDYFVDNHGLVWAGQDGSDRNGAGHHQYQHRFNDGYGSGHLRREGIPVPPNLPQPPDNRHTYQVESTALERMREVRRTPLFKITNMVAELERGFFQQMWVGEDGQAWRRREKLRKSKNAGYDRFMRQEAEQGNRCPCDRCRRLRLGNVDESTPPVIVPSGESGDASTDGSALDMGASSNGSGGDVIISSRRSDNDSLEVRSSTMPFNPRVRSALDASLPDRDDNVRHCSQVAVATGSSSSLGSSGTNSIDTGASAFEEPFAEKAKTNDLDINLSVGSSDSSNHSAMATATVVPRRRLTTLHSSDHFTATDRLSDDVNRSEGAVSYEPEGGGGASISTGGEPSSVAGAPSEDFIQSIHNQGADHDTAKASEIKRMHMMRNANGTLVPKQPSECTYDELQEQKEECMEATRQGIPAKLQLRCNDSHMDKDRSTLTRVLLGQVRIEDTGYANRPVLVNRVEIIREMKMLRSLPTDVSLQEIQSIDEIDDASFKCAFSDLPIRRGEMQSIDAHHIFGKYTLVLKYYDIEYLFDTAKGCHLSDLRFYHGNAVADEGDSKLKRELSLVAIVRRSAHQLYHRALEMIERGDVTDVTLPFTLDKEKKHFIIDVLKHPQFLVFLPVIPV